MNSNLALALLDQPYTIYGDLKMYQPKVRDVIYMGEGEYNSLLKIWLLTRRDLIQEENEISRQKNDFEIWTAFICSSEQMQSTLYKSCLVFFHKKIEFFPITNTIYIGEGDKGLLLDSNLYSLIQSFFIAIDYSAPEEKDEQFKKTDNMSERERKILERLEQGRAKLNQIKSLDKDRKDSLGKQIISLAAIGHYTFTEVLDMTMIQFVNLIKKYVEIQAYEIRTMLSPYMSSKDQEQNNKHWLD